MAIEGMIPIEVNEYFGLNTKQSVAKQPLGFSTALHDIDLSDPGIARTRGGALKLNGYDPGVGDGALEVISGLLSYLSIPDHADFDFSGGTFTIDFRFRVLNFGAGVILFNQATDSNNKIQIQVTSAGRIQLQVFSAGTEVVTLQSATGVINLMTFYDIEMNRSSGDGTYRLFVDGTEVSTSVDADVPANYTGAVEIGRLGVGTAVYADAEFAYFRLSDSQRNAVNFTPATSYASDGNTMLLLQFEGDDKSVVFTDASSSAHTVTANGGARIRAGAMSVTPRRLHEWQLPVLDRTHVIGAGGTKVFDMAHSGRWETIGTVSVADKVFDFLNYGNQLFMSDGFNDPKVYDFENYPTGSFRNWGIEKPTQKNTFDPDDVGALSGEYRYAFTYYNSTTGHESTRSPLSDIKVAAFSTLNLKELTASSDSQVDKKRIYRTTSGGSVFLFLAEIDDTDTTYADNNNDATLLTSEAPEDNDPPPKFIAIVEWDGRVWGIEQGGTKVKFSNDEFLTQAGSGVPEESFSPDNFIDFKAIVRGISKSPNFNELWVHTNVGVFAVKPSGVAEDPYYPVIRNSSWHTIAPHSIINIFNDQWFMAKNGKWISIDSAGSVNYETYFIENTLAEGNQNQYKRIQAAHYRRGSKNQLRFIYPLAGKVTFDRIMAANYFQRTPSDENGMNYPVWEQHNINCECIASIEDGDGKDRLYTGHDDGYVRRQDFGTNDDGSAIDWLFDIGWSRFALNMRTNIMPRWIHANMKPQLVEHSVTLTPRYDFGKRAGTAVSPKAFVTGDLLGTTFKLGTSTFTPVRDLVRVTNDLGKEGFYARLEWSGSTLDQVMELHNFEVLVIRVEGERASRA